MNHTRLFLSLLAASGLPACAGLPGNEYAGSVVGRVESRSGDDPRKPAAVDSEGRPVTILPPAFGIGVAGPHVGVGAQLQAPFRYRVRANDGRVHQVDSAEAFAVGDCVAFFGNADGPDRTRWPANRVRVQRGTGCN